jgi:hypothetical protein
MSSTTGITYFHTAAMKIVDKDLKYIINHVFLPPKLPQKCDSDTHRKDSLLLDYVTKASKSFADTLAIPVTDPPSSELKVWTIIQKTLKVMGRLYADGGIVRDELKAALQRMDINGDSYTPPKTLNNSS